VDQAVRNNYDNNIFNFYYTSEKIFSIYGFDFYGSMFYKLKLLSLKILSENNFIYLNQLNFFNYDNLHIDYPEGIDPHSDYFGYLSNYGLIGFVLFIYFFFYFFRNYSHNLSFNLELFLVYSLFLIESILSDVIHLHLIWILFGVFYYKSKIIVDNK
tara:strand:- start:480 stop:950 length:471 start_codon:yes stop_codon:yes gene_type:complete